MKKTNNSDLDSLTLVFTRILMITLEAFFSFFEKIITHILKKSNACSKCGTKKTLSLVPGDFGYYCPKCNK